ncbi:Niemann-Pick type C-2c [Musca autumnalis]|uniref:Niemann-Pick type C-2c n=1 Tax=Musca autumnalis TaxID=221902 RepID=UPI003CE819E0
MTKFTLVIISVVMLAQGITAETPVRECSNHAPLPFAVQVDSCQEMPCDLWKGSDLQMIIQFVATRNDMLNLKATVKLTTLGVQIPFELGTQRSDVCANLLYGAYCPLYKDEDVTYHLALPIEDHQPEVPTKVEVSLLDSMDNSVIACFVVDGKFKKPQYNRA